MSGPGTTQLSLLVALRQATPAAWETLVELYGPLIYGWCQRAGLAEADAQDVGQEVFQAVLRGIAVFRKERPEDTFRGWLHGVTQHKLADHWRKRQNEPRGRGGASPFPEPRPLANTDADLLEVRELADRALRRIRQNFSEQQVRAFLRTTVDGQSAADVADELGLSRNAVYIAKSRILHAIRLIQGDLDPGTGS